MIILNKIEKQIKNWIAESGYLVIINLLFGVGVYFMLISQSLVNSIDGISFTSSYIASWEVTSGRGLLHYLDNMRFGVVSVPLNSILTLLIVSISIVLILRLFSIKGKLINILFSFILIANPVICVQLSLSYTAVNYSVAFLLSVIAVYCIYYNRSFVGILSGSVFIAMSMGCYQAYFSVICLLLLLILVKMLLENKDRNNIYNFIFKSLVSIPVGGILYYIQTYWLLRKNGYESLSSYKGGAGISIGKILCSLPSSILQCYKSFYKFFERRMYLTVPNKVRLLLLIVACIMGFCIVYQFANIWKKNKIYAICFLTCIFLIPIAATAILLIAVGNGLTELMAMALELCVVLLVIVLPVAGKAAFWTKRAYCLLMCFLLWAGITTISNDQLAMAEGKEATKSLAGMIVNQLIVEEYLNEDYSIALVGKPSANELFANRPAWNKANGYAQFGAYWPKSGLNVRKVWMGILREYCGIQLNHCTATEYNELIQSEEITRMPTFPYTGSIKKFGDVIVVKISESY